VVTVIEGGVQETTQLLKQKFDHIVFTGNGAVGRVVMRAAAEHLTPVTLELGGKSPCIIDKTANMEVTARRVIWAKFLNCGQTCVAPDYLLVEKSIEKELLEAMKKVIISFYGEDPQKSTDYSRIINERHTNRLISLLDKAKSAEGEIVFGGTHDVPSKYIAPTIVRNIKLDSPLMEDELFGPLLPVLTFDAIEEAVKIINSRDKPLACYIFSTDKKNQKYILANTSSGSVGVNDAVLHVANDYLPFGGVGPSGMGHYHGNYSFKQFSHQKAVFRKGNWMDNDARYPPYTSQKMNTLKRFNQLQSWF